MTEKSLFSGSEASNYELKVIEDNLKRIKEKISLAMDKAGRKDRGDKVRLMAVTKTVPYEKVNYAVSLGIDLLGENRVQEFLSKNEFYDKKTEVHFIGGLQSNKVKYIIDKVKMIHSVDSIKLVDEINKRALSSGRVMDILIEVNIGNEESKGGFKSIDVDEAADYCAGLEGVKLRGFMTIPPIDVNGSNGRYFRQMQRIFADCRTRHSSIDTLSMGMSGDYEQAVLYGSNIVRIGSALFGNRKY